MSYALKTRSRSPTLTDRILRRCAVERQSERNDYFWTTRPITDCSGTASPSRYHHFASQRWHVVNASSRPATVIVIEIRSPDRQVGHVPLLSAICVKLDGRTTV